MENIKTLVKSKVLLFLLLILVIDFQQATSGLQVEQEFYTTHSPNFQDGNKGIWGSLVNVDRQNNRSKVDVHIPIIFDMTNDNDRTGKSKLDLSVLGGLVTVNRDREKQPNGTSTGPLTVTVFGIPVYTGYGGRKGVLQRINDAIVDRKVRSEPLTEAPPVIGLRRVGAGPAQVTTPNVPLSPTPASSKQSIANDKLLATLKSTNDKVLQSMADTFEKFTAFVTQAAPISNVNGKPADKSHGFVAPSRFSPSDMKPTMVTTRSLPEKWDKGAHESHVHV